MNLVLVTQPVLDGVRGLLSDPDIGFNTTLAAIAQTLADGGMFGKDPFNTSTPNSPGAPPFTIAFDFTKASKSFYTSWLSPEMLQQTSVFKYPVMALYGMNSESRHEQLSAAFSGPVQIGLDIHLSWAKSAALQDTETLVSAVESTIYTMFQPDPGIAYLQQSMSVDLAGFGALKVQRTPLKMDAQNWLQSVKTTMMFDVVV